MHHIERARHFFIESNHKIPKYLYISVYGADDFFQMLHDFTLNPAVQKHKNNEIDILDMRLMYSKELDRHEVFVSDQLLDGYIDADRIFLIQLKFKGKLIINLIVSNVQMKILDLTIKKMTDKITASTFKIDELILSHTYGWIEFPNDKSDFIMTDNQLVKLYEDFLKGVLTTRSNLTINI